MAPKKAPSLITTDPRAEMFSSRSRIHRSAYRIDAGPRVMDLARPRCRSLAPMELPTRVARGDGGSRRGALRFGSRDSAGEHSIRRLSGPPDRIGLCRFSAG
ncbi:hypothetical protein GCM10010198_75130 [Nocardia seriolae]|nr:hypothetical protein NSERKGN1266_57760 [Nocardia seriolae]BEK94560.1 hypothetical protein NSER024013_24660 [Nocardia seriolae]GEM22998.1 hypothetical protein NS2_12370 [Nocardia seriolae NBRC 15557]